MAKGEAEEWSADGAGAAWRRRVYYVSGFDPKGPRRYHRLYRREGARQAGFSGYRLETGPLTLDPRRARWRAALEDGGRRSEAEITMLRWDDIARDRMRAPIVAYYRMAVLTLWRYVASGAFLALCRARWPSTLVGLYPPVALALYLGAAAGLCAAGWLAMGLPGALLGGAGGATLLRLARRHDGRTMAFYLMADLAFTADHAAGAAPEIEARIDRFAEEVAAGWARDDCDEVLVVGHSSGAAFAVSALARALRRGAGDGAGPRLSLLTLGQTTPMLSFLPGAARLRADLALVARTGRADWIDVTSVADGGCYALVDPAAASGAAGGPNPKVISAKFSDRVSPALGREMRRSRFRTHIQYLCAFDLPGDYDYFRLTAGCGPLARHFAHRRNSPRAVTRPLVARRLHV